MTDEPLLKKKFGRWFGRKSAEEAESEALEAGGRLPTELTKILNDGHHSTPVLLRKLQAIIKREHLKIDTAILEGYAHKINAGKNVIDAITELRTSAHDSAHLDLRLERGEEVKETEHQTKILGQEAERAKLHGTIDQQRTAQLEQILARDQIRQRIKSARARPLDDDFEDRARREMSEHDDVLVAFARLQREILARNDITEGAKKAAIEWLEELTAQELRRRMGQDPSSS